MLTLILFVFGAALLIVGAELLVRGASRLAGALGISPLVIGLTVVAFGTSSPEAAVSVGSAFGSPAIYFREIHWLCFPRLAASLPFRGR